MTIHTESLLHYLRRLTAPATDAGDAVLLERVARQSDESAFATLLMRHGPMVLGVCRRILRNSHDAEDAFQATFLVLARKAAVLRRPEALASWLYGTACHLASTARRRDSCRRRHENYCRESAVPPSQGDVLDELSARELLLALDEELARLPESYRLPLILCHLEGRTQQEAARLLGWTAGSVKGRLERGRKQLQARLSRRGLGLGAGLLALESMATATVSAALRQATVQRALTFASGSIQGIAASILSLAETGVTSMAMTKTKVGLLLLFVLGLAGGAGVLANPLHSEKANGRRQPVGRAEEQRTATGTAPERKTESSKSAPDQHAPTDLYGDPLPTGAIARLGTVRFRHGGWLMDVRISPDGRTLISAGDRSVEIWDAQTGRRKRVISFAQAPPHHVSGIDLSPDGKLLVVNNYEGKQMRFWDLASGAEVDPFGDAPPEARRAIFSPSGELLATLDFQNPFTVSIWDIRKRKKIYTLEGGGAFMIRSLSFSPNGKMLAFSRENSVCLWDLRAGKELHRLNLGEKARMGSVAFSSDGNLLAAARYPSPRDSDSAVHLWDTATGKEVGVLKGHEDFVMALAVSPKSNLLASASRDGTIRFWDLDKRQEIGRSSGPPRFYVALHFSDDGKVLVSGENDGILRLWDPQKREELPASAAVGTCINWVSFAPDGRELISTEREQMGLWDPLSGRPRRIFRLKSLYASEPALSPDGKTLATVDWMEGRILLWDVATGKLVRPIGESGKAGLISSCTFSPDGRRLAGGSYREDIIRVWDAASGKELQQLKGQQMARAVAFSPDGTMLVSASAEANSDYTVRLWKLATGREIWRKATRPWSAFNLAFSPDGRILVLVGGMPGQRNIRGEVRLWDAATGKELRSCEGPGERVGCLAFSSDGRMLATGCQDNTVRLWEVATGQERRCFQGHQSMISSVSFSPDGRLLASASADTTALVWDLTDRFHDGHFHMRRLSTEEQNRCWNDLAHADAARAYRGIVALIGSPKETVAFLKNQLPPLKTADPKRVAPLLAALDSEQFAERDKAMAELAKLGLAVEPALRKTLDAKPSLETRRRIETILEKLAAGPRRRFLRALEVVEQIGTAEALQVLETLSRGSAELWPTQEAKASLARLAARPLLRP